MFTTFIRRLSVAASAVLLAAGAAILPASSASAAERDGVCDGGEVCFFYNSDFQGAVSDFTGSVENYGSRQPMPTARAVAMPGVSWKGTVETTGAAPPVSMMNSSKMSMGETTGAAPLRIDSE